MTTNLHVFNFHNNEVRTIVEDGQIFWVGKDVCDVLGYVNSNDAIKKHCRDGVAKRYPIADALGRI